VLIRVRGAAAEPRRVRGDRRRHLGPASYNAKKVDAVEMPFMPGRVVLQDFTGVPCVVDLAAMRDAMKALGGDPRRSTRPVPVRPGDRPLGAGRRLRDRVALTINARRSSSATTSGTSSSSGASRA
jgi:hypothetical protein